MRVTNTAQRLKEIMAERGLRQVDIIDMALRRAQCKTREE